MNDEYYGSEEQCFWEWPCNQPECPTCLRFHADALRERALARCRQELAAHEATLRAGHTNVEGLCRALVDWSTEMRMIEQASKP